MSAVVRPPRVIDRPTPGLYRTRLVKGGPWVAARIWHGPPSDPLTGEVLERAHALRCEIDGRGLVEPVEWWTRLHGPIPFDEWLQLKRAAESPTFAPRRPVNFNTSTPVF